LIEHSFATGLLSLGMRRAYHGGMHRQLPQIVSFNVPFVARSSSSCDLFVCTCYLEVSCAGLLPNTGLHVTMPWVLRDGDTAALRSNVLVADVQSAVLPAVTNTREADSGSSSQRCSRRSAASRLRRSRPRHQRRAGGRQVRRRPRRATPTPVALPQATQRPKRRR
jgi:hypothetical protein